MARQAAMVTDQQVHPFRQAFPRIAFVVLFTVACVKVAAVLVRVAFRYRVELVAAALFGWLWATVSGWVGNPRTALWYLVVPLAVVGVVFALPACPRRLARLLRATRYTRWLVHVLGLRIRLATLLGRHWSGRPVLWLLGSFSRARTRRRLYAGMRELRVANTSRQLPRIRWTASTAVGERVTLACR